MTSTTSVSLPKILSDLEEEIMRRGLLVAGVGARGEPHHWLEPAIIDVKLFAEPIVLFREVTVFDRTFHEPVEFRYRYSLECLARPHIRAQGLVADTDAYRTIVAELREYIIAGGRRHAMKGDL